METISSVVCELDRNLVAEATLNQAIGLTLTMLDSARNGPSSEDMLVKRVAQRDGLSTEDAKKSISESCRECAENMLQELTRRTDFEQKAAARLLKRSKHDPLVVAALEAGGF